MLMVALGSASLTICVNWAAPSRGMSSAKKLGARSGTLFLISLLMLVWMAASVTNKVRPSPSATTSACVCAPGRCRFASAKRGSGAVGRGIRTAIARSSHAIPVSNSNKPKAAPINASENKGSRAVSTASAMIAMIADTTQAALRGSMRALPSTIVRNRPAAGTVRARAKGGRAKAMAMSRP